MIYVKLLKQLFKLIHRPITGGIHCFVRSFAFCRPFNFKNDVVELTVLQTMRPSGA